MVRISSVALAACGANSTKVAGNDEERARSQKKATSFLVALVQPEGDEGRVLPIDLVREFLSG